MANRLPRLQSTAPITDKEGRPSLAYQRYFQSLVEAIEKQVGDIAAQNEKIIEALEAAGIALDAAMEIRDRTNLANSSTDPSNVLSSSPAAEGLYDITVSAHDRVYGDGSRVSVFAGTIINASPSTTYYVVYDDQQRVGGAVTFLALTNGGDALQIGARHRVGIITTPNAGGGGGGVQP